MTLKEMLDTSGAQYERFGFEQAALTLNCLRQARVADSSLLSKIQEFILVKQGQLEKAKT